MTDFEYEQMICWKKNEFHENGWNAMDMCVKDILICEDDLLDAIEGMKRNMLEGDSVIHGDIAHPDLTLVVRYYCDNLSTDRKRIFG